uniref:C2H2 type zinc finger protein n=1 Tax=Marseillevirus LCMAC202 TaxID=2506606 RepID=A0A481YX29_9VIRU|nr:MAG: C2H2 type zinc finger protein [Marseillevirus LCMAC202]
MKAKYCVALQEQRILQEQRTLQERHAQKYVCESCGIELTRKDNLKRHQEVCKRHQEVKKEELLERQISHLTNLVEKLASKPDTNVNNVNRNVVLGNLQPVVEEDIEALAIEYLTIDDIKKGVVGLVTFVLNYPLGERIICTDKSRKKLQYKDAEGNVVNDPGGVKLSQTFFKAINPRNQELIRTEYEDITTKVQDIVQRGAADEENVTKLMLQAMQLQTLGAKCNEIAEGGDNDVRVDFVNQLTKQL